MNLCGTTSRLTRTISAALLLVHLGGCQQGSSGDGTGPLTASGLKTFATTYGGTQTDRAHDVQPTADGGYIVAGETESFGRGEKDAWLFKLDPDGNWEWSRSFGDGSILLDGNPKPSFDASGALDTHTLNVVAAPDGGCIAAGALIQGFPDSDTEPDRIIPIFQIAVVKLNSNGLVEWRRTYAGGQRGGRALALERSRAGGYLLAGYVEGRGGNRDERNRDFIAMKIEEDGTESWRKVLGGSEHEAATCIQEAEDGGVVLAGLKGKEIEDESPERDAWVVKLRNNESHDVVWEKTFSDDSGVSVYGMTRSLDGASYAIAGRVQDDVNNSYNGRDNTFEVWVVNVNDADGDDEWSTTFASNPQFPNVPDHAFSIEGGPGGGFVLAGFGGLLSRDGLLVRLDRDGDSVDGSLRLFGTDHRDEFHSLKKTSDGGYIVAGFRGLPDDHGFTDSEAWAIKLRGDFVVEWERTYDFGNSGSRCFSVDEIPGNGGFVLAGGGSPGGWILKTNRQGDEVWRRRIDDRTNEAAKSVAQTDDDLDGERDDGYVVVGYTESASRTSKDAWILKVDREGGITWQQTIGGAGDDEAYSVMVTQEGDIIVAGETDTLPREDGELFEDRDAWVVRLDPEGRILWQSVYGDGDEGRDDESAFSIQEAVDGTCYVAGTGFSSGATFDSFLLKLGRGGVLDQEWAQPVRFNARLARSLAATRDGGCVVAGIRPDFDDETNASVSDFWVAKVDKTGAVTLQATYAGLDGRDSEDAGYSILEAEDGGYAVAGYTRSFGGGRECQNEFGATVTCANIWVLRLNEDLSVAWEKTYATATEDKAYVIRGTRNGGFIVAGETDTSFLSLEGDERRGIDAFILKIEADGGLCSELTDSSTAIVNREPESGSVAAALSLPATGLVQTSTRMESVPSSPAVQTVCLRLLEKVELKIDVKGEGRVTSEPEAVDCTSDCTLDIAEGTRFVLTATPAEGWEFEGWGPECPDGMLRVESDVTCTVSFRRPEERPEEPQEPTPGVWTGYWEDTYVCTERCGNDPATTFEGSTIFRLTQNGSIVEMEDVNSNFTGRGTVRGDRLTWRMSGTYQDGRTLSEDGVFTLSADQQSFTKTSGYTTTAGAGFPSCSATCTGSGRRISPP